MIIENSIKRSNKTQFDILKLETSTKKKSLRERRITLAVQMTFQKRFDCIEVGSLERFYYLLENICSAVVNRMKYRQANLLTLNLFIDLFNLFINLWTLIQWF